MTMESWRVVGEARGARPLIDTDLWDEAGWFGVAFLGPKGDPPRCRAGLLFRNAAAATRLFSALVQRIGPRDAREEIRLAFIEGDIPGQAPGYTAVVGAHPVRGSAGAARTPSHCFRLHDSGALAEFKASVAQHERYLLVPSGPIAASALAHGEEVRGLELCIRRPDGKMVPILASAAPVRVGGQVLGAVAVRRDIRTLKELERLREEWSAVVAHDLRQPVSVIALTADRLPSMRAGALTDQERRAIERLKRAAGDLRKMIDDLLDASLVEARRLNVTPAPVSLDGVVSDVLASMPELAGHPVRYRPSGRDRVWADRTRVEQILRNLLSNAVKYGEPGGEIGVDVRECEGWVETAIANQGHGIEPDDLGQLFQRFKRTEAARASGARGAGLGLYVTKGLVEAQGGRIWVESTPGEATIVHFTLPIPVAVAA